MAPRSCCPVRPGAISLARQVLSPPPSATRFSGAVWRSQAAPQATAKPPHSCVLALFEERGPGPCKVKNHRERFQRIDPDVSSQVGVGEAPARSC